MNTTEQTSDPTLWRYPNLYNPNRAIHIRNLEAKVEELEKRSEGHWVSSANHLQVVTKLVHAESQLEEARWLLGETLGHMWNSPKDWLDRRDAWLSAHTPTGKEK